MSISWEIPRLRFVLYTLYIEWQSLEWHAISIKIVTSNSQMHNLSAMQRYTGSPQLKTQNYYVLLDVLLRIV
jgi:hypothetical protein